MNSKIVLCISAALAVVSADGYDTPRPGFVGSESRLSQSRASFGGGAFTGGNTGPVVPILADDRQAPDASGAYSFNFETGDGVSRQEQGSPQGPSGAVSQTGGWSYTLPDGTPAVFRFVADENGFRVESDLLPTPPPLPPHAIEQIERARLEQSASNNRGSFASQSAPARQYASSSAPAPQFVQASAPGPQFAQASAPGPQFAQAPARQFAQASAPAPQFSQVSTQGSQSASNNLFGASTAQAPQFGRPSAPRPSQRPAKPSTQYGPPQ